MTGYPPVGVEAIDREHFHFDAVLRNLAAASRERDERRTNSLFAALLVRAEGHFASEERLMRSIGYAALERHTASHRDFVRRARACLAEIGEHGFTPAVTEWIDQAVAWFERHVTDEDAALGRAVAVKG